MKKLFLLSLAIWALAAATAQMTVSDTRYDWSNVANSITSAQKPPIERARDIYHWITQNIAYDTSYSIRTADATFDNRRGVCQGYSELFYRLAEAVGLHVEIVGGKAKDHDGNIDPAGHAWIFAYTEMNSGILIDPTWGAGSVNNGVFTREPNERWFAVDPYWMIFSHYPDVAKYQLLGGYGVDAETFGRIPYYDPLMAMYGYNGPQLLDEARGGAARDIPVFYHSAFERNASAVQLPLEGTLRVGTNYKFFIRTPAGARFIVANGDHSDSDWVTQGEVKGIKYMPHTGGVLHIGSVQPDGSYEVMATYKVAEPTEEEIARLEVAHPLMSPALRGLVNFDRAALEKHGIDCQNMLKAVKSEGITQLPKFYDGVECQIYEAPVNGRLKAGVRYSFVFGAGNAVAWAAVNGDRWFTDVIPMTMGASKLVVTPEAGKLRISAKLSESDDSYTTLLEYDVD